MIPTCSVTFRGGACCTLLVPITYSKSRICQKKQNHVTNSIEIIYCHTYCISIVHQVINYYCRLPTNAVYLPTSYKEHCAVRSSLRRLHSDRSKKIFTAKPMQTLLSKHILLTEHTTLVQLSQCVSCRHCNNELLEVNKSS